LQLFFARVLRSATEEGVRALFARFGKVYEVNLFRAFQGAPTTRVKEAAASKHVQGEQQQGAGWHCRLA
jgi:hypothetical protein